MAAGRSGPATQRRISQYRPERGKILAESGKRPLEVFNEDRHGDPSRLCGCVDGNVINSDPEGRRPHNPGTSARNDSVLRSNLCGHCMGNSTQSPEGRAGSTGASQPAPLIYLTCPVPTISYFDEVSSASAKGPRQWSFCVLMPISAPKPNSPPSVKRVDAFQ